MATLTEVDRYLYAERLMSFLDRHEDSVELLTKALELSPDNPVALRMRGHRYITLRRFDEAIVDLTRAGEMIAGQPDEHEFYQRDVVPDLINIVLDREDLVREQHIPVNEETIAATAGMYKSTLHGSIWYHLAVAKYLTGDFQGALDAFELAAGTSVDDDLTIAILDWRYMSLRRLGRDAEAAELLTAVDTSSLDVTTTEDFYLRRVRLYKGESSPEDLLTDQPDSYLALATQGYGVGNWHLYNGDESAAKEIFQKVVDHGTRNAFAYMAAEVDLTRLKSA